MGQLFFKRGNSPLNQSARFVSSIKNQTRPAWEYGLKVSAKPFPS